MSEEAFARAARLYGEGHYVQAERLYADIAEAADTTTVDKVRAWNNTSACRAARREYAEALTAAEEALKLSSTNAKAYSRAATACEGLQRYEDAIAHWAKAHEYDKDNVQYLTALARLRRQTTPNKASSSNNSAPVSTSAASGVARDMHYYEKSLQRGKAAMQEKNYSEAIRCFTKALTLFPHDTLNSSTTTPTTISSSSSNAASDAAHEKAVLLCNRSAAHYHANHAEDSLDDATAATRLDANYARAFFRVACALQRLKRYAPCYDAVQRCLELDATHAEAQALREEVEPMAREARRSAAEKASEAARVAAALQAEINAAAAPAQLPRSTAHAASYAYCKYCNETGHVRADCPLLRHRKRARPSEA